MIAEEELGEYNPGSNHRKIRRKTAREHANDSRVTVLWIQLNPAGDWTPT